MIRAHSRIVFAAWFAIVILAVPLALHQSDRLTSGGFAVPGSQSAYVDATLARHFPKINRSSLAVLLSPQQDATSAAIVADIVRVQKALRGLPGLTLSGQARAQAVFAAGLVGPITMPLEVSVSERTARDLVRTLAARLDVGRHQTNRVRIDLLGQSALWAALQETSKRQLAKAEAVSFPMLIVVLLVIFGSFWAATLPLVLGAVAVVVTGALIYLLSLTLELSVFTVNAASMLGIGIAVDYSLIVIGRVRQELQAGRSMDDARTTAMLTSGRAVLFSGLTVMAALAGVWVVPIGTLRSMALGAVIVVAMSVLATVTLLPTLMSPIGARRMSTRVFTWRPWRHGRWVKLRSRMSWERWTDVVVRRPLVTIVVVSAVLLTLCLPVLSMRTGTGVLNQLDAKSETRVAFAEAAKLDGAGALGSVFVVLHSESTSSRPPLQRVATRLRSIASRLPSVHELGPTQIAHDDSYAVFTITPTVDPESPAAESLVRRLRRSLSTARAGLSVAVGGASARQLDEVRGVAASMWKVILAVLAFSFIPLMVLLRSVVLPIKAIAMNLLSVGAAYGILVIVFQWGWFNRILHYHSPGHIDTLIPPLLLAIVFGLSTDYEVFLLSRIRESWLNSGDSRRAVAEGLAKSAKTISSAAFVIVCVFAVFVGTGVPTIKELGLGSAFAIAIDATLIRLMLVPAAMTVLGDWNWWLPRPLARIFSARPATLTRASVPMNR